MASPTLEFNYDISCPFAYIASLRLPALTSRTSTPTTYRPVLLGAIYRSTSAPQGAAGSASDVFNPTKKLVASTSMQRTLKRYQVGYNPPKEHPRKTVNALRLLYCVDDGNGEKGDRKVLTERLFCAYWVEGRDVADINVLLTIAKESGVKLKNGLDFTPEIFNDVTARKELESATQDAIDRGAFGVPGFWIPEARWTDFSGEKREGRFFWGQDRMHFVEATLLALKRGGGQGGPEWNDVDGLKSLMPRSMSDNKIKGKVKLEFWYDFSSPWAFLGWTQLQRLQRTFGPDLEIVKKPFLLGILFREIGAPNLPMAAVSQAKALWSRQDHADWVKYWNAVNVQDGSPDKNIDFQWAENFPIRTPTVLRCVLADPSTEQLLYSACWEQNENVSDESVLEKVLNNAGYDGAKLIAQANSPAIKTKLRELTAEAKTNGICGVPTYRILRETRPGNWELAGGIIWGQDETNVVEDVIAGWDIQSDVLAEPRKAEFKTAKKNARL